jgi:hypothetical protein
MRSAMWSEREDAILERYCRAGGPVVKGMLAESGFSRTLSGIRKRAARKHLPLGVWGDEELAILRKHAARGVRSVECALRDAGYRRSVPNIHSAALRHHVRIAARWGLSTHSPWTAEEDDILRGMSGRTVFDVRERLSEEGSQRAVKTIRARARKLNVELDGVGLGPRAWGESEDVLLRRLSVHGPVVASKGMIAAGFGRSPEACAKRMRKLGLRHRICANCGAEYNIRKGNATCPHCAKQSSAGCTDPAAAREGLIAATARRTMQIRDPWKSGEIPQRPWHRTPDPQLGF